MTSTLPLIVEFVGVAGSGKTTIAQALSEKIPLIHQCVHPNPRNLKDTPFYIQNCLKLWWLLSNSSNETHIKTRREFAWMAILQGWPGYLRRNKKKYKTVILDQGPIFLTAAIHYYDLQKISSSLKQKWWQDIFTLWANTLDVIVKFDASDEKLQERIRTRGKWHIVKNQPDKEVQDFINLHRTVITQLIPCLVKTKNKPRILTFDTTDKTIADTINLLMDELRL